MRIKNNQSLLIAEISQILEKYNVQIKEFYIRNLENEENSIKIDISGKIQNGCV